MAVKYTTPKATGKFVSNEVSANSAENLSVLRHAEAPAEASPYKEQSLSSFEFILLGSFALLRMTVYIDITHAAF